MALLTCRNCQQAVSSRLTKCPHCGWETIQPLEPSPGMPGFPATGFGEKVAETGRPIPERRPENRCPEDPESEPATRHDRSHSSGDSGEAGGNYASDFLNFRIFIYPAFIRYCYLFLTAAAILFALGIIGYGVFGKGGVLLVLSGLIALVIFPLLIRIFCEISIVLFKIQEELRRQSR